MFNLVGFLELSSHSDFLLTHYNIMIVLGVDPSNFLKSQTNFSDVIDFAQLCLALDDFKAIIGSSLFRFIDSLYNNSNTSLIMRILSIISI